MDLQSGRYVVAVSGGVDSMVLLHLLHAYPDMQLTVAHYDHGIREDSAEDRHLVQETAKNYGLPFVYELGALGSDASEAEARRARYQFLRKVQSASGAQAIVTAHHQDDLLETAILNLLRGTGRRGLTSLKSTDVIRRPLLHTPKAELLRYARREGITWREDSTNVDDKYMRNYVRHRIMPRFAKQNREALLQIVERTAKINNSITEEISNYLHMQPAVTMLDRYEFIMLPHTVAREVMAEWLLQHTEVELSRQLLERLVTAAKTGRTNSKVDIDRDYWLEIGRNHLALKPRER